MERDHRSDPETPFPVVCKAVREGARLPVRMTEGASGWDLFAAVEAPRTLEPDRWAAVPTGLVLAIPPGLEGVVRPRSGWALRDGVGVLNSPGTIDCDYRGELQVLLMNWGPEPVRIEPGTRIAQIVFQKVTPVTVTWGSVDEKETRRGAGGFGHTGIGTEVS